MAYNSCKKSGATLHITGQKLQYLGPRMSRHDDDYGTGGGVGGGDGKDSNPSGVRNWGAKGFRGTI